jgi:GT2 family glycosyltransferase
MRLEIDANRSGVPTLSVIVPVHQGASLLPQTLGALVTSDLPRRRWELIVVDDASTDDSVNTAAKWADLIIPLPDQPRGPGFARNRGVEASRGDWVVFIDADVVVHPNTLGAFVSVIDSDPSLDAVFGAYDDAPPAPGFLSQYRNLLHHHVHLSSAGEAETFWAGCGAVRRAAFMAAGGFDERRYARPQIEDIELGYRLRDRGGRIVLHPEIQGAHLKRWTFRGSVRTDLFDRGIPWIRLLLERGSLAKGSRLNLKRGERIKTALVGFAVLLLAAAILWQRPEPAVGAGLLLLVVVSSNLQLVLWFARCRGVLFALGVIPMNLWYHFVSGLSVVLGFGMHLFSERRAFRGGFLAEPAADTGRGTR